MFEDVDLSLVIIDTDALEHILQWGSGMVKDLLELSDSKLLSLLEELEQGALKLCRR